MITKIRDSECHEMGGRSYRTLNNTKCYGAVSYYM